MSTTRLVLFLCASAWMAGCSNLSALRGTPDGTAELLRFAQELPALSEAEIAERRRDAEHDLAAHDSPAARLRLALLLRHDTADPRGRARAEALLQPLAEDRRPGASEHAVLARHLLRAWGLEARHRGQLRELEALRKQNATLERQLQGIRNIEQQLERRDAPPEPAR